jgi:hypothetical protein
MKLDLKTIDGITPELKRISREISNPRKIMAVAAKELEICLREHFADLNAQGNKQGWPSSNFWAKRVAENTALTEISATRATVTVDSPEYAHKLKGGTINPKRGRALAIPANAQAYAKGSPRELDSDFLELIPIRAGGNLVGFLRERQSDIATRGGRVWYWLLKKVTHRPERGAQPDMRKISRRILSRVRRAADRVMRPR